MTEYTLAGLHAENGGNELETLRTETKLFARDLGKRFEKLEPDIQSLCAVEIETIKAFLVEMNQQFLNAKTKCAKKVADEQK